MLYRKAETEINKWIKDMDCALLVTGARQVGKTYIIRECLKNSGYDVLEINLVKQPQYLNIFNSLLTRNINDFIDSLSLIAQKTLTKNNTIIFNQIASSLESSRNRTLFYLVLYRDYSYLIYLSKYVII